MLKLRQLAFISATTLAAFIQGSPAQAIFLDGNGHYSLRGETQTNPGYRSDTGTYQAIEQNFSLDGEARLNDRSSFFMQFRLFDENNAYLGDTPKPRECPVRRKAGSTTGETEEDCTGRFQNTGDPAYQDYTPRVTEAYARYAFDYCLLEAGRRSREWGLGMFMSANKGAFDRDATRYDGVDCHINVQKSQTLGFRLGYDKLAETGSFVDNPYDSPRSDSTLETDFNARADQFGPNSGSDDIDQIFFAIEFDDRKTNQGAALLKNIGIYFANISSSSGNPSKTDLKYLDLYTGFYLTNVTFKNELLFRLGKSADPNWSYLGGKLESDGEPAANKLQAIALAGSLEYTFSRSGAVVGPAEYRQGNLTRHLAFIDYAYAPGSKNGYFKDKAGTSNELNEDTGDNQRDATATALAFHRNFHPALLLFNGKPGQQQNQRIDGVYDPTRVMNATLFGTGYRYESLENGNFEVKFITGSLNQVADAKSKAYYDRCYQTRTNMSAEDQSYCDTNFTGDPSSARPIGFFGKSLGYELDLTYSRTVGKEIDLGVAGGVILPGDAFKERQAGTPPTGFLVQTYAAFKF